MMNWYKTISFLMMIIFITVGLIFLIIPNQVLKFFNTISFSFGMKQSTVQGINFYLTLAVGYMYVVALLAYFMVRHPDNAYFPLILAHGKLASSVLSLWFFISHQPYLIYLTNCVVDGLIGILVLYFYFKIKTSIV